VQHVAPAGGEETSNVDSSENSRLWDGISGSEKNWL